MVYLSPVRDDRIRRANLPVTKVRSFCPLTVVFAIMRRPSVREVGIVCGENVVALTICVDFVDLRCHLHESSDRDITFSVQNEKSSESFLSLPSGL